MTKKINPNEVNRKLVRHINSLLDEVMAKPAKGKEAPSLTDKCKVIDRALKVEAIRLKVQPDGEGDFFKRPVGDDDDE